MKLLLLGLLLHLHSSAEEIELKPILVFSDVDKSSAPQVVAPGSQSKRDMYSIRKQAPNSFKKALSSEANVEFVGGPRSDAELPQIRGLSSSRILVLDEGVRQNFQSGHNGRIFSDYSLMENIEIVKGPWSSLYGSGAMGGIVSLRRSTAGDFIRRTGKSKGAELSFDAASNASEFGQRITGFARYGKVEPLVSFRHGKARDLKLGNGSKLPFSNRESNDLYSSIGADLGKGHSLEIKLNRFQDKGREPLNPESADSSTTLLGDAKTVKQDFVGNYIFAREKYDAHAKPYFRKTEVSKARVSDKRTDIQKVETLGIDSWSNLRHTFSDSVAAVFTLGGEYFRDRNIGRRNGAGLDSFPDGKSEQFGFYAQPEFRFGEKWKITPGLRHDRFRSESGRSAKSHGHQSSKKLYATFEPWTEQQFFLGWGQAFNAPRLQDLYISGLHFPGGGPIPNNFFRANPNLRPERAHTAEAGFKLKRDFSESTVKANGTYFHTEAKDFIAREVNITAGTTQFANLQKVQLRGFELGAALQRASWKAALNYGQVRSKDRANGQALADTSADHWTLSLEKEAFALIFGTDLRLTERQKEVPAGASTSPGYFVQDFFTQYLGDPFTISFRVNNIHDKAYRRHASTNLEQGRDFRLVTSYLF
jgi:hemoglobin/transferrin/lactoferrin receptor protein